MTIASGPNLALLFLAAYRKLVDAAVLELEQRGYGVVTPTLHYAMLAISSGAATASELAQALAITKQAAAKTIGTLISRGFVQAQQDPHDSRRKLLTVTDLGQQVLTDGAAILNGIRETWAEQAGTDRLVLLESLLEDYVGQDSIRLEAPGWASDA